MVDQASAALTPFLATTKRAFVLATLRSGQQAPDAVVALWKDELAERIELHPFTAHEVEELLSAALPDRPRPHQHFCAESIRFEILGRMAR